MVKNFEKLYNHERKVRFLEEEYPNPATQQTYNSLLQSIAKFEIDKQKDLCDFSYNDAVELLIGLKKKTVRSLDVAQTIINKYVDWCEKNGYSKITFNNFTLFDKENLEKYTHQIAKKNSYLTRERLYEIADLLYNWVDKALLVLPFEGVRGRTESDHSFEELRNLKYSDLIPSKNQLILTRDNGDQRGITVDERTMNILIRSMEEDVYHKNNGEAVGKFSVMPLKNSGYVVRGLEKSNNAIDNRMAVSSINTKFRSFRQYTGIQFLNPTILFQSGLIELCVEREKELGRELQPEDYREIYKNLLLDERGWFGLKEMHKAFKNMNPN